MVLAAFTLILIPAASFWMFFGRALLTGSMKIKADHLYKGSAMLLILCMLPVVFRFSNWSLNVSFSVLAFDV